FVTCAGNAGHGVYSWSHQALWQELPTAAINMLATPGMGSYLPANTESYSLPNYVKIAGPDWGPTTYTLAVPNSQTLYLGQIAPGLDPFLGTSAAAPAVAAVAALMLEANRQLTNLQIDAILSNPANATPINGAAGAGLVNAALAVAAAQAMIQPIAP